MMTTSFGEGQKRANQLQIRDAGMPFGQPMADINGFRQLVLLARELNEAKRFGPPISSSIPEFRFWQLVEILPGIY
jgi:hypothetical protein